MFDDLQGIHISEYYNYCIKLLLDEMRKCNSKINIIFGNLNFDFKNDNKVIRIDVQYEHTLVLEGGRSVEEKITGNIFTSDNEKKYLVRIPNFNYYNSLDHVIEYSNPNIINCEECPTEKIKSYSKKCKYISPLIYDDVNLVNSGRHRSISLFSRNSSQRREFLLDKLNIKNFDNVFSKNDLKNLYGQTKIMVNIHQTDHHHTFEELRVLPALLNGVIVISEDVPLKKSIPYHEHIIWCDYNNIIKTLNEVTQQYEKFYNLIFTKNFIELTNYMKKNNVKNISSIINY